jgi:hypothetical protein
MSLGFQRSLALYMGLLLSAYVLSSAALLFAIVRRHGSSIEAVAVATYDIITSLDLKQVLEVSGFDTVIFLPDHAFIVTRSSLSL